MTDNRDVPPPSASGETSSSVPIYPPTLNEYLHREQNGVAEAAVPFPPPRPKKRFRLVLFSFVFIVSLGGLAWAFAAFFILPADADGEDRPFSIAQGTSVEEIVAALEHEGFVRSRIAFALLLRVQERTDQVKAGMFTLSSAMTPGRIADILTAEAPPEPDVNVTIPEGFTALQIVTRLQEKGAVADATALYESTVRVAPYPFLPSCAQARGPGTCTLAFQELEGYLFPDTYRFAHTALPDDIVEKFLANFDKKLTAELRLETEQQGRTFADIVTMASLIEEEAKFDGDRARIAGILYRRLTLGMPLQVDATVLYAKERETKDALENRELSREDTAFPSPYNTYLHPGLPPGPIANPGLKSLIAAVRPESSSYLFYLHTPEGETIFSETLEQHNAAKARYLQ